MRRTQARMNRRGLVYLVAALALAAALVAGCGERRVETKVVLIGIDGMDWQVADPLIEEGRLPNIEALIDRGVKLDLRSIGPEMKSPIIWTSIATGKTQHKHGISDFVEGEQALFNSLGWRARGIWDIFADSDRTAGVINWWLSWPASEVNGYMVTERIVFSPEDDFPEIPETTWPPELIDELRDLRQPVSKLPDDVIEPYLVGDAWKTGDDHTVAEGVESFRGIYAADETVLNVTKHMLAEHEQPDFFGVYFQGLDVCCHRYWGPWDPTSVDIQMSDELVETFSQLIPRYYERMDRAVGEILGHVDENSIVIICSDHGFRGPWRSPEGIRLGIWMHRQLGVMVAAGPGIESTDEVYEGSVFDVTPTVLALVGEPVARDMDGFVLTEIIEEDFLDAHPVTYIDTYETGGSSDGEAPETPEVEEAIREKLRSLGYIE